MNSSNPIAYMNGQFVAQDELQLPPQDMGFMWGVTVAEQLRTFGGKLFQLKEHLDRLFNSLRVVDIQIDRQQLEQAAVDVCSHNFRLLDSDADLGLTIFITPGLSATYAPGKERKPFVGIHSYPLPFSLWAEKYEAGQACEIVSVRQVSSDSWPRHLKSRSRMHYYLADKEARSRNPASRAILLDDRDNINEASTANVVAYFEEEGFVSPPREDILPGISLAYLESLVQAKGEAFTYRAISSEEFMAANEVLLTSTPFCILPVSQIGQRKLPSRSAFKRLMDAWSDSVGIDIVAQRS